LHTNIITRFESLAVALGLFCDGFEVLYKWRLMLKALVETTFFWDGGSGNDESLYLGAMLSNQPAKH
jgi:hypothetical protein